MDLYQITPTEPSAPRPDGKDPETPMAEAALAGVPPYANLITTPTAHPDGLQDIVFAPEIKGAVEITFTIDTLADDLTRQVAEIAETAFVAYGEPGLGALADAFRGHLNETIARGDGHYLDPVRTPRRDRLLKALDAYWSGLQKRVETVQGKIAALSAQAGLDRLTVNAAVLLNEAHRYLSLGTGSGDAAQFLSQGTTHTLLTGPDMDGLTVDLLTIAAARVPLAAAASRLATQTATARTAVLDRWYAEEFMMHRAPANAAAVAQALATVPLGADVRRAQADFDAQRSQFAALVTRLGGGRPILFRMIVTDLPERVARQVQAVQYRNPAVPRSAAVVDFDPLRIAVAQHLGDAYRANQELVSRFKDVDECWKFDSLVDSSLRSAGVGVGTFAARVAQDRLAAEQSDGALTTISSSLGNIALVAGVLGAEPLAVGLSAAQLALDAFDVVLRALELREKQLGADAFLDSAQALDVDQSWVGLGVSAFFVLLGIATSGSGLKSLTEP
jgi:hypothetical protein